MNRVIFIIALLTLSNIAHAYSTGTAFAVNSQGYLITNHHVISDAKTIIVRDHLNNFFTATIVKQDEEADLAVLKIQSNTPNFLLLGDSESVKKGEKIYAIGFPHVDFQGGESKVTEGIVNSLSGFKGNQSQYQISAEIQSGNSGGPLIRKDGSVIGVITSKLSASKLLSQTGDLTQNVNYAIKVNEVSKRYSELLGKKTKAKAQEKLSIEDMIGRADKAVYLVIASEYSVEREKIGLLKPYIKVPQSQIKYSSSTENPKANEPEIAPKNLAEMGVEAYHSGDYKTALEYFSKAAEHGDIFAQYHLGIYFSKGVALTPDYQKAKFWFQKAADQGDIESTIELGRIYFLGLGGEKDLTKGEKFLLKAANIGNVTAQSDLGVAYLISLKDSEKALYWLEKAASQGDGQANGLLALNYSTGKILPRDLDKAFQYSEIAVKADFTLGYIISALAYHSGAGVNQDKEKAQTLINEAVSRGDDWYLFATYALGKIKEDTNDINEAYNWIIKSAEAGFSEAEFWVGRYLYITKKDVNQAEEWLLKAANQNYLPALEQLGWIYRDKQEFSKAYDYYKKAADLGHPDSQVSIAWFYFNGVDEIKLDLKESFNWNLKAAKQGHDVAMFNVGQSLLHGTGVTKNYNQAFEWLMQAAKKNVPPAQNNVGAMYLGGTGVEKNKQEGLKWLKKAAELNDPKAIENLKNLEAGLELFVLH